MMNRYITRKADIKVCKQDVCVNTTGKYAAAITIAAVFTICAIGIAALIKANR